jgi:serine phosphatase RsbU (regulator of sigma subunit)
VTPYQTGASPRTTAAQNGAGPARPGEAPAEAALDQTPAAETPRRSPGRVLIVDDSFISVEVVSDFMLELGWEVGTAQSGAEALEKMAAFLPEVVVCDLNMPDLDGIEVFRRLNQLDSTVQVIMLSSEDNLESVLATMHAGVFDFVQKKDCMRMLPTAAARAVSHGRIVRENRRLNADLLRINEALERRVEEQTALLEDRMRRAAALETAAAIAPLRKELEIAQHIQTSILPKDLVVPGLELSAQMVPAAVVGGDYYDVRPVPDGCWIGIGDVSGHGLTAGLFMMMIQSGISALTLQRPDAMPHEVLPHLNRMLWENVRERLGRDDFATLCLLRYQRDGRLTYAGAHEDILVCHADGTPCEKVAAPGTWLGGVRDITKATTSQTLFLRDGDTVVLFTDGITEARSSDRTLYGVDRLCTAIERRRTLPVDELRAGLLDEVLAWGGSPEDDMSLLVLRYRSPTVDE